MRDFRQTEHARTLPNFVQEQRTDIAHDINQIVKLNYSQEFLFSVKLFPNRQRFGLPEGKWLMEFKPAQHSHPMMLIRDKSVRLTLIIATMITTCHFY